MRVLLTGFGPFLNIIENPTALLVERLMASPPPGIELQTEVLPVSYHRASLRLKELLQAENFDLAVLLGVAGNSSHIRLEALGRNSHTANANDEDGMNLMGLPVVESGAVTLQTQLDLAPIVSKLESLGYSAQVSQDAGGYVCNDTYYAALHAIDEAGLSTKCVFIHVPPHPEATETPSDFAMPVEQQEAAIRVVLDLLTH
jgi:pyroglutamyl-peptidase